MRLTAAPTTLTNDSFLTRRFTFNPRKLQQLCSFVAGLILLLQRKSALQGFSHPLNVSRVLSLRYINHNSHLVLSVYVLLPLLARHIWAIVFLPDKKRMKNVRYFFYRLWLCDLMHGAIMNRNKNTEICTKSRQRDVKCRSSQNSSWTRL